MKRDDLLRKLLLRAYPDRVTVRRAGDPSRGVMVGGRGVVLHPSSSVREAPLFLCLDPEDVAGGGKGEASVSLASAIDRAWLEELFPEHLEERIRTETDPATGTIKAARQQLFRGLVIREHAISAAEAGISAGDLLAGQVLQNPEEFLQKNEAAAALLARSRTLAGAAGDPSWPAFSAEDLAALIRAACEGASSLRDVQHALLPALQQAIGWNRLQAFDAAAPERIEVPTGSNIRLQYDPAGQQPPVLGVRLQEMFGLKETPSIASGRLPVKLHLLGPNMRPVQITSDLVSFWKNTYPEVRKELRGRYPKHSWPEDPLAAPPMRGAKKRH